MQDINSNDPITIAAAASTGYTPQMHSEMYIRVLEDITKISQEYRVTDPRVLNLYETALYHAVNCERPHEGLHLYDRLGGYAHLGWRLADYRRGLRMTSLLMQVYGADYMDVRMSPAHDHNLFLIALGQPNLAEEKTRHLLQHGREMALAARSTNATHEWTNPFAYFTQHRPDDGFAFYEGVLVQTLCDALLAQGKLQDAEALMSQLISEAHDWTVGGRQDERRNGSNPYGRRAVARALSGDVEGALADFKLAATFSAEHSPFFIFPSRDWHHRIYCVGLLTRLGHLAQAQRRLELMNIDRIRYRPLTAAAFDIVSAEIAYARMNDDLAAHHANLAVTWASESGHQHTYASAVLILAKLSLRAGKLDEADSLLKKVEKAAKESAHALQHVDCLILQGYLAFTNDDIPRVEIMAVEAETISEACSYGWGKGDASHLLARCAEARGEVTNALHHVERASKMRKLLQDPKVEYTNALAERLASNM